VAHAAPLAAKAPWTEGDDESTSIMNAGMRDAVLAATGHTAPRPGRDGGHPQTPGAPRPVTAAAHPPRPVTAPRAPSRTVPGVAPPAPARPVARSLSPLSVAAAAAAAAAAGDVPEVDWYVGIGGTPIGPVRLSVIRDRAAAHEVDGDSLVWREGMGEWRPLRTIPELLEVVTAAQAPLPAPTPTPLAATPARAPAPAAPAPMPAPPPAPAPAVQAPLAAAPVPTPAPAAPAPAAAVAPLVVSDPFAKPAPAPAPTASPFAETPLVTPSSPGSNGKVNGIHHPVTMGEAPKPPIGLDAALGSPLAAAVPAGAQEPRSAPEPAPSAPKVSTVDIDPRLEEKLVPRRSNTHPMAYAFIAAAMAFAGVAAYVLLIKPPPPKEKEIVYVTVPGAPTAAPSGTPDDKSQPQVDVGELTTASSGRPRLGGPWAKSTATSAATTGASAPIDTSGFVSNVPGPTATGPVGPAPGGQLTAGEIQGVVSSNQAMMRRKCWEPALQASSPTASSSAKVGSTITIGPSGNVESASAGGAEKDYPGLSSCIADRIKHWKFPPPGGSQTVNIPFNFVRQ
jgi:hypothetical protein